MTDARPGSSADDASFATTLVAWQRTHGRQTLPWQQPDERRDAYRVWLAEIMLQQTQVAAVVPFYRRFLARFPDVRALAAASLDDVMLCWSGLGYYSRARNLHATATRVVKEFGGRFPETVEVLETLPGIGRSTAGAIAAFAFGRRAAILDGNVKRVFARIFAIEGLPAGSAFTRRAWAVADALLPDADIERYTQGLMDLGATICTPRNPSCLICPFETTCIAHRERREDALPERAARRALPRRRATLVIFERRGEILLERRPPIGIWGGLWSLPEIDRDRLAFEAAGLGRVMAVDDMPGFVHGFTHFVMEAAVVRVTIEATTEPALGAPDDTRRWVSGEGLATLGLPAPIRSVLALRQGRSTQAIHRPCG